MHRKTQNFLRVLGLDTSTPPDAAGWQRLVGALEEHLADTAQEHQLLRETLRAFSRETQDLLEERKNTSDRVALERDKLRSAVSSMGAGLCLLDAEGRLLTLNPEGERIIGFQEEELQGEFLFEKILPSTDAHKLDPEFSHRAKAGHFLHKSGDQLDVSFALTPVRDEGLVQGAVLVFFDIREQLRMAQELRESQQVSRSLVQALPEVIFSMSFEDGRLRSLNPAFEALTGWSCDDWIGEPFQKLLDPRDLQHAVSQTRRLAQGLRSRPFEVRVRTRAGRSVPVEVVCTPLTEEDRLTGVLGIARDVTARQRAERQMLAAKEAAEEANRAKGQFLANVSHELRTPLNAIIGMTGLLLETDQEAQQQDFTETIRTSADTLLALVNDILDFSRIESGKLHLEVRPFQIEDCLRSSLDLVAPSAAWRGLELTHEIGPGVPRVLLGDSARLQQIVVNLLSNAIKFTDQGSVQVKVGATQRPDGKTEVQVGVHDTGIGITENLLEGIFESFQQGDTSDSRRHGGTGLGLAICRRLVALMGGRIWAESTPGQGSTFRFTFLARIPREAEALEVPPTIPKDTPLDPEMAQRHPLRILVAEDNVVNQKVTLLMLEKMGYRADLAANGVEAVTAVERQRYDVVLMDVQMPELDGLDATRQICRKIAPDERPRIVAMTASAMAEDHQRCLEAGMDDYLSKPVHGSALQAALRRNHQPPAETEDVPIQAEDPEQEVALDSTALRKLHGLQPERVEELVRNFLEHAARSLQTIRQGVEQGDLSVITMAAHSLKGSAGTLGARKVAQEAGLLEAKSDAGRPIEEKDMQRIDRALEEAHRALAALLLEWEEAR